MSKRAYISGPMSGIADYNRPAFHALDMELQASGYWTYNPANVKLDGDDWHQYMKIHLQELPKCDVVFVLNGWQQSRGARIEAANAWFLGIPVLCWPEKVALLESVEIRLFRTYDGLEVGRATNAHSSAHR